MKKLGYKDLNKESLDQSKFEAEYEMRNKDLTLSRKRSLAGRMGGLMSAFSRLGNKSKRQRSEIMKKLRNNN